MGRCSPPWLHNKWMALVAAMWLMASAGLAYTFSVFSEAIKEALTYSQLEVDLLGTASDFGNNAGLLAALLSVVLPEWVLLLTGALMSFGGFLAIFFISTEEISTPPFWAVALLTLLAFNGTTFFSTVALVSSTRHFPRARGVVVGLLTALFALSSALYTNVYDALLPHDPHVFLLQLAVGPAVTALLVVPIFCGTIEGPEAEGEEAQRQSDSHLSRLFLMMVAIAAILFAYTFGRLVVSMSHPITRAVAILTVLLLVLPIVIPLRLYSCSPTPPPQRRDESGPSETTPDAAKAKTAHEEGSQSSSLSADRSAGAGEVAVWAALCSANFWLNAFSMLLAGGSALTLVDNLAQIVMAQGNVASTDTAVSFVSLWIFTGVVAGAQLSEHYLRENGLPRPAITAVAQLLMIPGHLLIAFGSVSESLYIATAFIGVGFGVTFTLSITTVSDVFGTQNFAIVYNLTRTALPIGSFLFSSLLASYVYDGSVLASYPAPICYGVECFRLTFIVMAGVALLSAMCTVLLAVRTRKIYRHLQDRHPSRVVALEDFPTEAIKQ